MGQIASRVVGWQATSNESGMTFIVARQAAKVCHPCTGAFYHLASRQQHEATPGECLCDDLQLDTRGEIFFSRFPLHAQPFKQICIDTQAAVEILQAEKLIWPVQVLIGH